MQLKRNIMMLVIATLLMLCTKLSSNENKIILPQSDGQLIELYNKINPQVEIKEGIAGLWCPLSRLTELLQAEELLPTYIDENAKLIKDNKNQKILIIVFGTAGGICFAMTVGLISGLIVYSVLNYQK